VPDIPVIPVDQVDSQTKMSKSARATNTVEIGLGIFWEIEIDNYVDSLNVDTSGKKVGADQVAADAVSEVVKDAVAVILQHLCMRVETRVPKLCNLFGQ